MTKRDWLLAGAVLLFACMLGFWFRQNQVRGHYIRVQVNGEEYGKYKLGEDQVIEINGKNRLEIQAGQASMIYADCPDQICVHMVPISRTHEMIVCMPNQVTVEVFEE